MHGTPLPSQFWGKIRRLEPANPASPVVSWHPLIDHAADVTAALVAVLGLTSDVFAPSLTNRRLAYLGSIRVLERHQVERLGVVAALHDLGKFNHGFQDKAFTLSPSDRDRGHIGPALALFPRPVERFQGDPTRLQRQFANLFLNSTANWMEDALGVFRLLLAALAHHGAPGSTGSDADDRLWRADGERDPFKGIKNLVAASADWLPSAWTPGGAALPNSPGFQHAFAGLVQLADWLGSDERWFRYAEPGESRWPFALEAARQAVQELGLNSVAFRVAMPTPGFAAIGAGRPARPAQTAIGDLPLPDETASTVVLEDETGAGKTEAALLWFARLFAAGKVDGLYFALPTRTAATQIHDRVRDAATRLWPTEPRPRVVLAVPGYLRVDGEDGERLPGFQVLWPDQREQRDCSRWAAEHPKRYLAACIAVGTVDQALLSALAVPHSHLRAACLFRQLLVVDEVHASDAYMTAILRQVLERHRAAGGHALLMSATLGGEARARFLGTPVPSLAEARAIPYPHVVRADATEMAVAAWAKPRRIALETSAAIDDPVAVARLAQRAAAADAKVLVIRNTVAGCLAVFDALGNMTPDFRWCCAGTPAPHHARFAREDRELMDKALEDVLGSKAPGGGVIVCATQTVQQALDLDADFLLTDLCPADVLLQRLGRLHRHRDRERPVGFEAPRAVVLVPDHDLAKRLTKNGQAKGLHGLGVVYPDLRGLDATWRHIKTGSILVPDENRAWVEDATHPEALAAYADEPWRLHGNQMTGQAIAQRITGQGNCAKWDAPFGGDSQGRQAECFPDRELAEEIRTRLGTDDRLVALPPGTRGAFANEIRHFSVPGWWLRNVDRKIDPIILDRGEDLRLSFGRRDFIYDEKGLRPVSSDAEDDSADA